MTILYDSIPGRLGDKSEREALLGERSTAYAEANSLRKMAGLEDDWKVEIGAPIGNAKGPRSVKMIKIQRGSQ